MATNLAQARRNYYGDNTNNGSRTGARINGRVRRKTMMGGSTSGPISLRANRSESMEQEADAAMERQHRRGILRARQERDETAQAVHGSRPTNGVDVPVGGAGKPAGYWKGGRSAGSQVYVPGSPPATATAASSTQDTTIGQRAMMTARRIFGAQSNLKAKQDRNFSRFRADVERSPGTYAMEKQVSRVGTKDNNYDGMAKAREEARKRGDLNPPPSVQY